MKGTWRKRGIIQLAVVAIPLMVFNFFGCDHILDDTKEKEMSVPSDGRAYLSFSVRNPASRTAFPEELDFASDMDLVFRLSGSLVGTENSSLSKTWNADSANNITAYTSMTNDKSLTVDVGSWNFTLELLRNDASGTEVLLLSSRLTDRKIVAGNNVLDFGTMSENWSSGVGAVEVSLSFPSSVSIATVTGTLYDSANQEVSGSRMDLTVTEAAGRFTATYTKNTVAVGTYWLRFEIKQTAGTANSVQWYHELIHVAANLASRHQYDYDSLANIYPVTYELNSGSWQVDAAVAGHYSTFDTTTLPASQSVIREGYIFSGWYEDAGFTGQPVELINSPDGGAKTYYAKWIQKPAASLDATPPVHHDLGDIGTVEQSGARLSFTASNHYIDHRWYLDGTKQTEGTSYVIDDVTSLGLGRHQVMLELTKDDGMRYSAQYDFEVYSINFLLNGGQWTNQPVVPHKYISGMTVSLPQEPSLEKADYTFGGWYLQEDLSGSAVTKISSDSSDGKVFYAKWTLNEYKVTLDAASGAFPNGGSASVVTIPHGSSLDSVGFDRPEKTGHTFSWWQTENGEKYDSSQPVTASMTLRATYGFNVTQLSSLASNLTGPGPHTIALTGDLQESDFSNIKGELIKLQPSNPTATIVLDFSRTSITSLPGSAFSNTPNLVGIVLPDTLETIGDSAFSGCTSLASAILPDNVSAIGASAFSGCTSLTEVDLPPALDSIGSWAFQGCTALSKIEIHGAVRSIGSYSFQGCTALTEIHIPDSVDTVGSNAFKGCTSLQAATLSSRMEKIEDNLFAGCTSLKTIEIPGSVQSIGNSAFSGCKALSKVELNSGLLSIGNLAFASCSALSEMDIPDTVETISAQALEGCAFVSMTIPSSVQTMEQFVLMGCTKLEDVTILPGVSTLSSTFDGCTELKTATLPHTVTTISFYLFRNCTKLETIRIEASTPPVITAQAFENVPASVVIRVPPGSLTAYMNDATWSALGLTIQEYTN